MTETLPTGLVTGSRRHLLHPDALHQAYDFASFPTATNGHVIVYAGGQRFRIDGGAAF